MFEIAFSSVLCFVPGILSECLILFEISVVFSLFLLFFLSFFLPFLSFTKCFLCCFAVFCAVAE